MGGKNSGGARPGTGPKKKVRHFSDQFKEKVWTALQKEAKEQGTTVYQVFAKRLLNPDRKQPQLWSGDFRVLVEILVAKESHQVIEKHELGPVIMLPPKDEVDLGFAPTSEKEFRN